MKDGGLWMFPLCLFTLLAGLSIGLFFSIPTVERPVPNYEAGGFTMHRLKMVESGGFPHARSPAGACGLYQIMQPTWEDMTDHPYSMCTDPDINEQVAAKYLLWLGNTLEKWMGEPPTDRDILAAWNGGIGRFRSRKYDLKSMPQETQEFVEKVMQ